MHFKVIVVGAGLAGLSAVGRLRDFGITNTFVLEARNDVGGRVRMTDFAGSKFNIGPEWIHGQKSNPIYKLATSKLNLDTLDCADYTYLFNKPTSLSISGRQKAFRKTLQKLEETVDNNLVTFDLDTLQGQSIADVLNLTKSDGDPEFDSIAKYWAFNYENGSSASDYSALIYRLSSKIFENVPAFANYRFVDKNAFLKIVKYYNECAALNDENICFNDPVMRINRSGSQIELVTQSDQSYTSDYCILAVPVSVISRHGISIYPSPGQRFHTAINKVPFSTYTRVFVELGRDMVIPDFDWFIDMNVDPNKEMALWQNLRHNYRTVLVAHVCQLPEQHRQNLTNQITRSLRNIFQHNLKSIEDIKVVSLDDSKYSFGAFPCAAVDFDNDDVLVFKNLGHNSRLQFAGDSYNLDYFGTVQGAVASGALAAERIHRFICDDTLHDNVLGCF